MDFFKALWDWLRWLFGGKPAPLLPLTNVRTEIDMSGNVDLTWVNPTTRQDGADVDGSEFEIRVGLRAQGAPAFTPLQTVTGTDTPLVQLQDQPDGQYEFELVLWDLTLNQSAQVIVAAFDVTTPIAELNPLTSVNVNVTYP